MDNTHPAKSHFSVFTLENSQPATPGTSYALTGVGKEFPNHEEARIWIEDHGERKNNYVVLEIIRKD